MMQFEMHAYAADQHGAVSSVAVVTVARFRSDSAARSAAGRLAKACRGPVDLARAGADSWNERYMTTASPSENHASGYRFERIG